MRVIAGKAGGIRLESIETKEVRPTLDKVKEALFSMILPYYPFTKGLDLFAGFGTLGLEAVSRGVEELTFVEQKNQYADIIRRNVKKCGFEDQCKVKTRNVFKYLDKLNEKHDIVFLDPPYKRDYVNNTLYSLIHNDLLYNDSLVIVEHHKDEKIDEIKNFITLKDRNYNDTVIKVYLYKEEK
ncbi:MAG: 16S rRNA (guanine(966)-N(2))-methyltransferase RsmD [Halanaerobiales bacterium]|nr:16S rRNA (guanine(966)-N(2))-methyltransferase RsmD [Halanaerobiales bacterium]